MKAIARSGYGTPDVLELVDGDLALQGLRTRGRRVQPGHRVLVNRASGTRGWIHPPVDAYAPASAARSPGWIAIGLPARLLDRDAGRAARRATARDCRASRVWRVSSRPALRARFVHPTGRRARGKIVITT